MPRAVKDKFRDLAIDKPEKIFIRLPSPASVFQDLRLYQNSAITQLAAKGLIDARAFKQGIVKLLATEVPPELLQQAKEKNLHDRGLTSFLVEPFSTIPLRGPESVYRKAGLPTRAIAA
jgi:hypothetical protein